MSLTKHLIDPDKIFYMNEKVINVNKSTECKLCGNVLLTEENYVLFQGLKQDCPYCGGGFPQLEES
jgi:hypothetical protein